MEKEHYFRILYEVFIQTSHDYIKLGFDTHDLIVCKDQIIHNTKNRGEI